MVDHALALVNDRVTSLWGTSANDVWAALGAGGFLHWTGTSTGWQPVATGSKNALGSVRGASATDVWAVGEGGVLLRGNGETWTLASPGATTRSYRRIWGTSATDLWIVGDEGTILHGDGTTFTPMTSGVAYHLDDIGGTSPSDLWATGEKPLHWDGMTWSQKADGLGDERLTRVWAAASNDVFGVWSTVRRWNGTTWTLTDGSLAGVNDQLSGAPFGMWGASATDVWVVGDKGLTMRWHDNTWSPYPSGAGSRLWDVHGSAANDVWAIGPGATHFDGAAWTFHALPTENYRSVFTIAPNDAWIVGGNGTILHWDGANWKRSESAATTFFTSVWASGPNDVWVVGTQGAILHRKK
jgi:hypothetical protein